MAIITFGATLAAARGSIGGTVISRNKGGAYMKARVAPINVKSPAQTVVRANFAANAKAWSSLLTAGERTAWTNFAAVNPLVNRLGASIIVSGLSMFVKLNQVLSQTGNPNITAPPPDLSVQPVAAALSVAAVSGASTVIVTTDVQPAPNEGAYYIFATRPLAPGIKPGQSDLRFMLALAQVSAAITVDISTPYVAAFGAWNVGASIGVSVGFFNQLSGAVTPAEQFNIVST